MVVLDTGVILDRVRRKQDISDNVAVVTVIEYPPVLTYAVSKSEVYCKKRAYGFYGLRDWRRRSSSSRLMLRIN